MTKAQDDAAEIKFWESPWTLKIASLLVTVLMSVLSSGWVLRSYLSDHDAKVADRFADIDRTAALAAQELDRLRVRVDREIVPRNELESHWRSLEDSLKDIHQDVREIRNAQEQAKPK